MISQYVESMIAAYAELLDISTDISENILQSQLSYGHNEGLLSHISYHDICIFLKKNGFLVTNASCSTNIQQVIYRLGDDGYPPDATVFQWIRDRKKEKCENTFLLLVGSCYHSQRNYLVIRNGKVAPYLNGKPSFLNNSMARQIVMLASKISKS